jgi:small nuclear ribonucleoprotein (snRNP)-like protein
MSEPNSFATELDSLIGQQVVLDVDGPFLYIGTLEAIDPNSVTLVEADAHDLRETSTSTDQYLIDTVKHGIRVNRRRVVVLSRRIISVSPLEAVVTY